MASFLKKVTNDEIPSKLQPRKPGDYATLFTPWEQEEPGDYVSSQFINFLDSKMKHSAQLKKSYTLQDSLTLIPDIESYTQNLTRSIYPEDTDTKPDKKILNRRRIAERALSKAKDASMSTTFSLYKKKSENEELSLEDSTINMKRSRTKDSSGAYSKGLGFVPQVKARMGRENPVKSSQSKKEAKYIRLEIKRPSTGVSRDPEKKKSQVDLSQTRVSFSRMERFLAAGEVDDNVGEKNLRESWDAGNDSINPRKKSKKNSSKNRKSPSEDVRPVSIENGHDFVESLRKKRNKVKSRLKARKKCELSLEKLNMECIDKDNEQGKEEEDIPVPLWEYNLQEIEGQALNCLFSSNKVGNNNNDKQNVVRETKSIAIQPRKFKVSGNFGNEPMLNRRASEKELTPLHMSSVVISSQLFDDINKTQKPYGFKAARPTSTVPQKEIVNPVIVNLTNNAAFLRPHTTKAADFQRHLDGGLEQYLETVLETDGGNQGERADIQTSIKFTNKIWNEHKDQYGGCQAPLLRNLKKCLEDRSHHMKAENSDRANNSNLHIVTAMKAMRPGTAGHMQKKEQMSVVTSPKMEEQKLNQTKSSLERAKRYFANKTFRVKENSVYQKSIDQIKLKASLDVSKSVKIHNFSIVRENETEKKQENNEERVRFLVKAASDTVPIQKNEGPVKVPGSLQSKDIVSKNIEKPNNVRMVRPIQKV